MKRPLAVFGFSLLAVLFAGFAYSIKTAVYLSAAVLIAAAVVLVFIQSRRRQALVAVSLAAITAVTVFSYNYFFVYTKALAYTGTNTSLSGTLKEMPEEYPSGCSYILKNCVIGEVETEYSVKLFSRNRVAAEPGDTVAVPKVKLSEIKKYAASQYTDLSYGVYLSASIYDESISVIKAEKESMSTRIFRIRENMHGTLGKHYSDDESGVLASLILGETSLASEDIKNDFRLSGLSHLFAVSGLHLTLWSGLVYKLFGIYRKRQRLQSCAAIVFVLFFMALTLFTPSVCRSGIMLIIVYLGNILRREADSLNSLGGAVGILLCVNPFYAANASFLLSVFATFSIVVIYPAVDDYINEKLSNIKQKYLKPILSFVVKAFALCITVSSLLIPLSAYFFGYTSFIAPLANLLCVFPAELAMILGAVTYLASLVFSPLGGFFASINGFVVRYLIDVTDKLASLPFAVFSLNRPFIVPWFIISAAAVSLVIIFCSKKRYVFYTVTASVCVLLLAADCYGYMHRYDVTLSMHRTPDSAFAVLTNGFDSRIYISLSASSDSFSDIREDFNRSNTVCADALIFLCDENSAASKASRLITELSPRAAICPSGSYITVYGNHTQLIPASCAEFECWHGLQFKYICDPAFSGVIIDTGSEAVLVCDGTAAVPEEYSFASVIGTACAEDERTLRLTAGGM